MSKKRQSVLALLVAMIFVMSIVSGAAASSFSDVQSNYFAGTTTQDEAVYKLNALGIIAGYPDGTFRPDTTITRAEFAKIAVYTAGLQDVASGMKGVPSTFSDVDSSLWYNGWVNVAAAQGYVKGFPDGTFKPDAQITQSEVITVFLRILGYNDNLYGDWPADYIAKAASLEIFDDVTFVANKAASRGEVAVMGSETLDQNVVEYQASDNIFEEDTKNGDVYSLLDDNFDGKFYDDAYCVTVDRGNEEISFNVLLTDFDKDTDYRLSSSKAFKLADKGEYYLANCFGSEIEPENKFIDFVVNDDDEVIYMAVKNHGIVRTNEIEISDNGNKVEATGDYIAKMFKNSAVTGEDAALDKKYEFADNAFVYPFDSGTTAAARQASIDMLYAAFEPADNAGSKYLSMFNTPGQPFYQIEKRLGRIDLIMNADGDIAMLRLNAYPQPALVDYVNYEKETISFKETAHATALGFLAKTPTNLKDKDYYIKYNGLPGTLEDIDEDDIVWVLQGSDGSYRGADYYLIVVSDDMKGARVTGTLEEVKSRSSNDLLADSLKEVVVDGVAYKALPQESYPLLSTDGGDDFEMLKTADQISGDDYDLLGEKVTLVFNAFGYVAYVISDVDGSDSGKVFGPVTKKIYNTTMGGEVVDMIKIMNKDEDEISYAIDEDTTFNNKEDKDLAGDIIDQFNVGDLISFTLKSDKTIDNIKTTDIDSAAGVTTVDTDLNTIKIGSKWYTGSDAVVFNVNAAQDDADVLKWGDLEDHLDNSGTLNMTYYLDDNDLQYVCLQNADLASDNHYAIFKSSGKDATDPFVKVYINGELEKVYLNGDASYNKAKGFAKGNVIEFEWDGTDIKIVGKAVPELGDFFEVTDTEISNNIVEINDIAYLVDEDTVVYDCSDTDNLEVSDLDSIARGEEVYFIYDEDGSDKPLDVIVITDEDEFVKQYKGGVTPPPADEDTASATVQFNELFATIKVITVTESSVEGATQFQVEGSSNTAALGESITITTAENSVIVTLLDVDGVSVASGSLNVSANDSVEFEVK